MFASQECSSACVAPFSYGNWSSMSCSSSYQLSRPCLSFCWVIQVVWSFKVCFSGSHTCQVVLLHFDPLDWTGATWVVLPLISWNGNTESSSWNLSVGKNCFRSLMFLFFKPKYKVEELWWSKPVNSTVRILGPNWIRTRLFLLEITGVIVSNWIASCESVAQVFREQQLNLLSQSFDLKFHAREIDWKSLGQSEFLSIVAQHCCALL